MRKESITEKNIAPAIICKTPWRIANVKPLENYRLEITFIDGTHGFFDMREIIMSETAGVFEKLRDPQIFNQVSLVYGVTTWPDEIDFAPDAIYEKINLQHNS